MSFQEPCQKSADNVTLPCGRSSVTLPFTLKAEYITSKQKINAMPQSEVIERLTGDAVMSYPLRETIEDGENILIVLPDATRRSGAEQVLPEILSIAEEFKKTVRFIIAVGTHRQPDEAELKEIMTPEIYEKYKHAVLTHDCEDYSSMDFYGITKRKTTVLFNKAYREHDTIITIGSVSYHYFAGYGGGRKLIFPGLASEKSISANHKLAIDAMTSQRHDKAVTGNLRNNPVHDDMVETIMIARSGHTFFAVNTILDENGKIAEIVCGDLFMSHIQAAQKLDEYCGVSIGRQYDLVIVSAGGSPKDINLVQAQKYLDRIIPLVKEGGKVLFLAECPDGYGNKYFEGFFDHADSGSMLKELMVDYRINRQTAYNLKTRLEAFDVYAYTSLDEKDCERIGFKKLNDLNDIKELAEKAENVAVVSHPADIFIK
ncbi:MAG: nickel-dependent lactate racemase [Deferribacterales bacterium]